jgi:hypothetical protein
MPQNKFDVLPFCESFYIESMLFVTESALQSVKLANEALKKIADESGDFNQNQSQILNYLQNIVVQGAALSRYFWPVRKEHKLRGQKLRKAYKVTESSPLKSRDLRNEIEHFDEKLDAYLAGGIFGVILPQYIGPLPNVSAIPSHVFRAYYTDKAVIEILGKRYEINPITKEIGRIHKLLVNSNGGRFPDCEPKN